jgi:hypothetical protein
MSTMIRITTIVTQGHGAGYGAECVYAAALPPAAAVRAVSFTVKLTGGAGRRVRGEDGVLIARCGWLYGRDLVMAGLLSVVSPDTS